MAAAYRIADEPSPSGLARFAVNPMWPLFAVMFCGPWLAWPWFVLNGHAMGSPERRRETAIAVGGFVGSAVVLLAAGAILAGLSDKASAMRYALLAGTLWKLLVSYVLYASQARTVEIYAHFGGVLRNGLYVLLPAALIAPRLIDGLTASQPFLALVLR